MKPEIQAEWVAALRSGEYKQGTGVLRSEANEFCCLGVLCDLAVKAGVAVEVQQKRLLDEEVHVIWTLQWHRIIPHNAKVKGWTITPSHYLNNQLDTVWLSE